MFAILLAAAFAQSVSDPPAVDDGPASPASEAAVVTAEPSLAEQMLAENNRIRSATGRPPQVLDDRLCAAAQEQADYLAATGQFDHHVNGDPRTRAARRGFRGIVRENLAGPFQSIANAFRGWCGSSGHYASIVSDCDRCGFGYAPGVYVAVYGREMPSADAPRGDQAPVANPSAAGASYQVSTNLSQVGSCTSGSCGVPISQPIRSRSRFRLFGR